MTAKLLKQIDKLIAMLEVDSIGEGDMLCAQAYKVREEAEAAIEVATMLATDKILAGYEAVDLGHLDSQDCWIYSEESWNNTYESGVAALKKLGLPGRTIARDVERNARYNNGKG